MREYTKGRNNLSAAIVIRVFLWKLVLWSPIEYTQGSKYKNATTVIKDFPWKDILGKTLFPIPTFKLFLPCHLCEFYHVLTESIF